MASGQIPFSFAKIAYFPIHKSSKHLVPIVGFLVIRWMKSTKQKLTMQNHDMHIYILPNFMFGWMLTSHMLFLMIANPAWDFSFHILNLTFLIGNNSFSFLVSIIVILLVYILSYHGKYVMK